MTNLLSVSFNKCLTKLCALGVTAFKQQFLIPKEKLDKGILSLVFY